MTESRRMEWDAVPASVRAEVEVILGAVVVSARSQSGGFSPGSADRVVTADGTRAFVKTAHAAVNAESVAIHRKEAAITTALPASVPAPRLLGVVDQGEWIALVLDDVDGRHPETPWTDADLGAVLDALRAVSAAAVPADLELDSAADAVRPPFGGWRRLVERGGVVPVLPDGLDAWVATRLSDLADAADRAADEVVGTALVHLDVRADNLLVRPDGTVVLVDWPWAARGAPWLDAFGLLINVRLFDPTADVEALIARHPVFAGMPPDAATRVLIGFAGFFIDASTQPPSPGIPTLRAFQRDQGIAALRWLRDRLGT
jgi:hypothetical protein